MPTSRGDHSVTIRQDCMVLILKIGGGGVFYSEPQVIKGDSIRQFTVKSADKRKEKFLKLGIHWKVGWT